MPELDSLERPDGWNEASISELVRRAQKGCSQSRNELFAQLRAYLRFVADRNVDTNLRAKLNPSDMVQMSMLRAMEQLGDYRGSTSGEFKGWLRQILLNEIRLARRGFAAGKRDVRREIPLGGSDSNPQPGELADSITTPSALVQADEQAESIQRLLAQLAPDSQLAVRLRNWDGLSFEEMGARMNMSTSGAAKVWYRALVELQRLYRQDHESRNR